MKKENCVLTTWNGLHKDTASYDTKVSWNFKSVLNFLERLVLDAILYSFRDQYSYGIPHE